ncbi:MAG: YVTN family beta-propeller protein [Cocleimonas sp.]|jgi:YVTN family beta-propeller protein
MKNPIRILSSSTCSKLPLEITSKQISTIFISTLLSISVVHSLHAHQGEPDGDDVSAVTEGVEHAKQDDFWADKAKDYPAFIAPKISARAAQRPVDDGAWSPVIQWPHIPVTAANLPDGRILTFASNQKTGFPAGPEFTYAATWNPATNAFVENNHNSHDMFCGHLSMLEDGRIFINGGRNHVKTTSVFDYRTNSWQNVDQMNRGRWYPTTVALPTGSVLTAIGSNGGQYPELWTEGQGWKSLTGANLQTPILSYTQFFERNWWPLLHVDPRGKVFHSGPTPKMHTISTEGLGSVTKVGPELNDWYPKHGATVMFDEGKILVAGGAISGSNGKSTDKAMIIDINNEEPIVTQIPSMNYPRKFQNGVMLPTGEVLIVGGNSSGRKFDDTGTILPTEIWNPDTLQWKVIDSISVPRNYHSIALLLTDGRVLSAGGGLCGSCAANHSDGQVLTPPYLYNNDGSLASRPVITNAPDVIKNGVTFGLQSSTNITKFSLIKMSSTTHGVNTDLRYLKMPFTHDGNGNYQLASHNNVNVLTPGFWMLFAVNSNGVPSVAKIIQVSSNGIPQVAQPNNQTSVVGQTVSLAIVASDPDNQTLNYQASGLPIGLSINQNTGVMSGQVITTGLYTPTITISDADSSLQVQFNWRVFPPGSTPGVSYEYFEGTWSVLPNFDNLTPITTGTFSNFNILPRARNDNFAFRLSARINITQAGDYTFYTSSDDGSRIWIDGNLVVENDGVHAIQERSGQINLSAGQHSIVVGFFERAGGEGLTVQYSSPNISKRQIPNSILIQNPQQNAAPSVNNPGDQISSLNAAVNLNITASDANGDTLTYSATGLPNGLNINNDGDISGTTASAGSFNVSITVNDGQGESVETSFNWQVIAPINIAPIEPAPQQNGNTITYNANVSGGNTLRYRWDFGDASATTSYTGTQSISHTYANAGTYVITLFVQDGSNTPVEYQFVQAIHAPLSAQSPTNSSSIVYESTSGNNRLWSVNPDNNTVTVFDAEMHAKLSEITVSSRPVALAIAPNGRLWVTNKDASRITIIDTNNFNVLQTINLKAGSQPHGIAFTPNGNDAFVALEGSGQLLRLNPASGAIKSTLNVGDRPRHIGINDDSSKVFVSLFVSPKLPGEDSANPQTTINNINYGGEVIVVNANSNTVNKKIILKHNNVQDAEHSARGIPNYLGPVVISPDGNSAWVASKQDNIKRGVLRDGRQLTHDSTVRSISSKINLITEDENLVARVDHDNGGIASTSIFSKTGNYLFVALEGSREIAVVDAYSNEEFYRFSVGRAPQGLALSSDGMTLFTHNFMDRTVIAHDISKIINARATQVSQLAIYNLVSNEKLALNVFNGKQLFYDARDQRLAREQYISCASCHNEGDSDGRVWDMTGFGEGLRNTIALVGHGGMAHGPLHWSANFDEVQDFEGQIRDLSGGTGLMSDNNFFAGSHSLPLGDPKAGISQELDDLAAYVASLDTMPISPNKNTDGTLTSVALQGQQLFTEKGCDSCHSGQHFTDSSDNNLHNVGTLQASSGRRLNQSLSGIDTPTLKGLWLTGPYLHNGSANDIEAAITAHTNVNVSASERSLLATYLNQLDRTITNPSIGMSNEVSENQITINGQSSDWTGVSAYANDANDISGTNNFIDINTISVAHDSTNLHLLYKNHGNINPDNASGNYLAWGWQVFIDTDKNSATGYLAGSIGADYIIEGNQVQRYQGSGTDWNWLRVGEGPLAYNGNTAELSFNRNLIGNPDSFKFVFMGANQAYNGTSLDLYPDNLNSAQANDQFFEYNFGGSVDNPPQNSPTAIAQTVNTQSNTSVIINLEGTDPENDPLRYVVQSVPSNGNLTGNGQSITYTPNNGFVGTDNIIFYVNDGSQNSQSAIVTIVVTATQTGTISNPVLNMTVDGNASDWSGISRFPNDPDDISDSGNIIDWQNAALAHNSEKIFLLLKNRNMIDSGSGSYIPWGWQTYFDIDSNPNTGYRIGNMGAEYILEGNQLHRYIGSGTDFNLAAPAEVESWYNNDIIEISFPRNEITNPSKVRLGFLGNNQAYEGLAIDLYPNNLEGSSSGIQYFEYSFSESVQSANRPVAESMTMTIKTNTALSVTLNTLGQNQGTLSYRIIDTPMHGSLSGTGSNRTYTPNNNYVGDDELRYIVQNQTHQSSIATINFKVTADGQVVEPITPTPPDTTGNTSDNDDAGGGSLPIEILLISMLFYIIRKK